MKAVVCCNFGQYDEFRPTKVYPGWDNFYFTDKIVALEGWNMVYVKDKDPAKISRQIKILTHKYLPDYDTYCYLDASMSLFHRPPEQNTRVKHAWRRCVYDENTRLKERGINGCDSIIEKYRKEGMPANYGMYANGYFVRDRTWDEIHEQWYKNFKHRDQISLPYTLWKMGYSFGHNSDIWDWNRLNLNVNIYGHRAPHNATDFR